MQSEIYVRTLISLGFISLYRIVAIGPGPEKVRCGSLPLNLGRLVSRN